MLKPRPIRNLENATWTHIEYDRGRYAGGYKITLKAGKKEASIHIPKSEKHRTLSQNYIDHLFWKMMEEILS